jgi:hypothetical protein
MKVFDQEWVKEQRLKYGYQSRYAQPYVARLAIDPYLSRERSTIDKCFKTLPDCVKPDMLERLRSYNSRQHFGAYYELVMREFFRHLDYSVDFHPQIEGSEPDLFVTGNGLEKPLVVEIATVFDDPDWEKEERKLDLIINALNSIKHYFFVSVSVESIPIPITVNYNRLKQYVVQWLDSFDVEKTNKISRVEYQHNNLELSLALIPKKPGVRTKSPIVGGHSLPARFVDQKQLRRALQKKVNKYRFVKERRLPYIVALSLSNVFADEEDVINELFGKWQVTIIRNSEGKPIETKWERGSGGLLTPKPHLHRRIQNRRLSAVITTKTQWADSDTINVKKPTRVHHFSVIHNPYAYVPVSEDLFRGYPQFTKTSQNSKSMTYSWIDKQPSLPFSC